MSWESQKKWSDQFLLEVKSLLGMHLIATAPLEEDRERNTDLIVLSLGEMRIGVRLRDFNRYYKAYGNQFTIRSRGRNGARTELQKIVDGWGHYFFYGFGDEDAGLIKAWAICRLDVFRREYDECSLPGIERENFGYDTCFRAFYWRWFPNDFLIAEELGPALLQPAPPIQPATRQPATREEINAQLAAVDNRRFELENWPQHSQANNQTDLF